MRRWQRIFAAVAASSLTIGGVVKAASVPLVDVTIEASTSLNGTYSSSLSGLTSGETIYLKVIGQMAPVGSSDNSKTITSLSSTKDGISSLDFNLNATGGSFSNINLATTSTSPAATVDWTTGSGASAGTISGDVITGIRPIISSSVDSATIASPGDVLWFGRLVLGSASSTTISASWTIGGSGGAKINGGSGIFITNASETGANPYVGYNSATLTEVVGPAPSIIESILVLASGLGLAGVVGRRRLAI